MTYNQRTVKLNLTRIDLCDLLLACTAIAEETDGKKWIALHEKLKDILDEFDEKKRICYIQ